MIKLTYVLTILALFSVIAAITVIGLALLKCKYKGGNND
jgi:hypothetical protein